MCSLIPQDDVVPAFPNSTSTRLFLAFNLYLLESTDLILFLGAADRHFFPQDVCVKRT